MALLAVLQEGPTQLVFAFSCHFPPLDSNTGTMPGGKIVISWLGHNKHMLSGGPESAWCPMASWSHRACAYLSLNFLLYWKIRLHSFKPQHNIILDWLTTFFRQTHMNLVLRIVYLMVKNTTSQILCIYIWSCDLIRK